MNLFPIFVKLAGRRCLVVGAGTVGQAKIQSLLDAEAVVAKQRAYLDYGELAMKPLGLRHVAAELGLHESTVSRVTSNKYMATPRGLIEFRRFFSRLKACINALFAFDGSGFRTAHPRS